jgi:hypothetical protein
VREVVIFMRELCINIDADLPRFMFGNKSSGILSEIARVLVSPKRKRVSVSRCSPRPTLQTEGAIRDRKERYLAQMQYLWSKQ